MISVLFLQEKNQKNSKPGTICRHGNIRADAGPLFPGVGAKAPLLLIKPGLEFLRFLLCKEGTKAKKE